MMNILAWIVSWLISSIVCVLLFIGVAYIFHIDVDYMIGIAIGGSVLGLIGRLTFHLGRWSVYRYYR